MSGGDFRFGKIPGELIDRHGASGGTGRSDEAFIDRQGRLLRDWCRLLALIQNLGKRSTRLRKAGCGEGEKSDSAKRHRRFEFV